MKLEAAKTREDFITTARSNAEWFDWNRFKRWLDAQSGAIRKVALICPPDEVYEITGDGRPAAVAGYKNVGSEAAIVVSIFGEKHLTIIEASKLKKLPNEV